MPPEETIQIQIQSSCSKSEDNKENVKNQHCLPLFAPFFRCQTNSDLNLQIGKTTFHAHRCIIHSKTDRFDFKGISIIFWLYRGDNFGGTKTRMKSLDKC